MSDRNANDLKSPTGTPNAVVISSQPGILLAVHADPNGGVSVPENLPKMTKPSIDGKALCIPAPAT